jgi:DNA-binding winged helix-turn-helix (wHTH) protein
MLLEHPGELVTREELQRKLWPADTFVDFDHGLNKAINKIREALGDSADSARFVETVARRGYRFLAEVRVVDSPPLRGPELATEAQAKDRADVSGESAAHRQPERSLAWRISGSFLVLLLVILVTWAFHSRNRPSHAIRSLAVLPLESLSGDASQDYFADGMTDELITDLGQIGGLKHAEGRQGRNYPGHP